jgi:uncharacterized protein (DUF697 family)/predicted GTPase
MLRDWWQKVKGVFRPRVSEEELRHHLDELRQKAPVPVIWLLGKTQSGKTSLIRYLTGAERAEIGRGFQPCTRFSSRYAFPTEQAPLLTFLDTRGLDEPGYDAGEDIANFSGQAHVVVVTVRLLDHAQANLLQTLKRVRAAMPRRPVVLVLTTLHEAYPQQQHPQPYPFGPDGQPLPDSAALPAGLLESLAEQRRRFDGLVDQVVAVDLTPAEEGFHEPNYGGARLREVLMDVLPAAQAQTLRTLEEAQRDLQGLFAGKAGPTIMAYSTLAATAGAVPIPVVDLVLISAVQTRMMYDLASLYGQSLTTQRLAEVAGALGLGLLGRQAGRSLIKVIPGLGSVLGSVAGGALAAGSTYALGKAFCYYYSAVLEGHVPDPKDLRRYYREELGRAEESWKRLHPEPAGQQGKNS